MFLNQGSRKKMESLNSYAYYLGLEMVTLVYKKHRYDFYFYGCKNEICAVEITYTKAVEKHLTEINYLGI